MRPRLLLPALLIVAAAGSSCPFAPCSCVPPPSSAVVRGTVTAAGAALAGASIRSDIRFTCSGTAISDAGSQATTTADGSYLLEARWGDADSACLRIWARRMAGSITDSVSAERMVLFSHTVPADTPTINLAFP